MLIISSEFYYSTYANSLPIFFYIYYLFSIILLYTSLTLNNNTFKHFKFLISFLCNYFESTIFYEEKKINIKVWMNLLCRFFQILLFMPINHVILGYSWRKCFEKIFKFCFKIDILHDVFSLAVTITFKYIIFLILFQNFLFRFSCN